LSARGSRWCVDRYSIADIHLFRLFWRFSQSEMLDRNEFPKLFAHRDRMLLRPAVQRTIELESAIGYELKGFDAASALRG
jgi:glutathione S-transferase